MSLPGSQSAAALSARRARRRRRSTPKRRGGPASLSGRGDGLPTVVSINAWARPRKPSASSRVAAAAAHVRPAWKPRRGSGPRSRRAGRAAGRQARRGTPHRRSQDGQWAMPVTECPAARGSCPSSGTAVEAERLGDRMGDDMDGDAGDSERGREADAERDDAHVLEARVGKKALPRERPPEERDRDREGDETETDEDALRRPGPDDRGGDCSERHATSSTAGSSAAERRRRPGRSLRVRPAASCARAPSRSWPRGRPAAGCTRRAPCSSPSRTS